MDTTNIRLSNLVDAIKPLMLLYKVYGDKRCKGILLDDNSDLKNYEKEDNFVGEVTGIYRGEKEKHDIMK